MGKDQTKASDHPSTNALDSIVTDPDTGLSIDRYLSFGGTPKAIPNPPKLGEVVEFRVKAEAVGDGRVRRTDGEMRYSCKLSIISVARAGEELPPDAGDNQTEMFDGDGNPTPEAEGTDDSDTGIEGKAADGPKLAAVPEPDEQVVDEATDGEAWEAGYPEGPEFSDTKAKAGASR